MPCWPQIMPNKSAWARSPRTAESTGSSGATLRQRYDPVEFGRHPRLGHGQVVAGLKVEPELGGRSEQASKPQSRVGSNRLGAGDDALDTGPWPPSSCAALYGLSRCGVRNSLRKISPGWNGGIDCTEDPQPQSRLHGRSSTTEPYVEQVGVVPGQHGGPSCAIPVVQSLPEGLSLALRRGRRD